MSLITRMLNDLDKRQSTSGEEQPIFSGVRLPTRSKWGGHGPLLLFVLVAIAAGIGALLWMQRGPSPQPAAPVPLLAAAPAKPSATLPPAVVPTVPVQVAAVPTAPLDVAPVPVVPVQTAPAQATPAQATPAQAVPVQAAPKPAVIPTPKLDVSKPDVIETPKLATSKPAASPAPVSEAKAKAAPMEAPPPTATIAAAPKKKVPKEIFPGVSKDVKPAPRLVDDRPVSFKVVSPKQRSENSYRQAVALLQQSRVSEAQQVLRQSIGSWSENHDARLLLANVLTDSNDRTEAMALLQYGLEIAPRHTGFSMALAQIQVASGAKDKALATLEKGLAAAEDDADYHAFLAALQQSQGQHAKATEHYIVALRSNPSMPRWLIGVGISLQAENKLSDAGEAFQRALDTGELSPELAQFAKQRLEQIRQKRHPG